MRRVLAPLLALAIMAPGAAMGASGSSRVTTLRALTVTNAQNLGFGSLIRGTTAGNVTINPQTGVRTKSASIPWVGGTFQPGQFNVNGTPNRLVTVSMPNFRVTRSGGTQFMNVNTLRMSVNGAAQRTISGSHRLNVTTGNITFRVAGRLNVAANQVAGDYSGNYVLTVNYQ